jgi:hypothetical protein
MILFSERHATTCNYELIVKLYHITPSFTSKKDIFLLFVTQFDLPVHSTSFL